MRPLGVGDRERDDVSGTLLLRPYDCLVHQCEGIDGASAIGDLLCSDLALRGTANAFIIDTDSTRQRCFMCQCVCSID